MTERQIDYIECEIHTQLWKEGVCRYRTGASTYVLNHCALDTFKMAESIVIL